MWDRACFGEACAYGHSGWWCGQQLSLYMQSGLSQLTNVRTSRKPRNFLLTILHKACISVAVFSCCSVLYCGSIYKQQCILYVCLFSHVTQDRVYSQQQSVISHDWQLSSSMMTRRGFSIIICERRVTMGDLIAFCCCNLMTNPGNTFLCRGTVGKHYEYFLLLFFFFACLCLFFCLFVFLPSGPSLLTGACACNAKYQEQEQKENKEERK